jgi:hypothetical protein
MLSRSRRSLDPRRRRETIARVDDAWAKDGGAPGGQRVASQRACERFHGASVPRYHRGAGSRGLFITTRTGQIEYRRDLHPDAVGHLAIVIRDVPLVPERWPLVDLGD